MHYELDIRRGDVRVVATLTSVFDGVVDFDEALSSVSAHRRGRVLSYRFGKDRRLSLLAGLLLDALLQERGLREHDMTYVEGEQGKPAFRGASGLHFSISHSGEMAVAALAGTPVGVDVERLSDFPRDLADPYRWTELESIGKALGCGVGAFVDAGAIGARESPAGFTTEHHVLGDYLVSFALQYGEPIRLECAMGIAKTVDGARAVIAVDGWLDTQTAPELGAALEELGDDVESLVLDLSALEYVSSAGIRQIVAAHKQMNGNLEVRNVAPEVLEVLHLTGVDKRLNIA